MVAVQLFMHGLLHLSFLSHYFYFTFFTVAELTSKLASIGLNIWVKIHLNWVDLAR
jgi:hypothetical protein